MVVRWNCSGIALKFEWLQDGTRTALKLFCICTEVAVWSYGDIISDSALKLLGDCSVALGLLSICSATALKWHRNGCRSVALVVRRTSTSTLSSDTFTDNNALYLFRGHSTNWPNRNHRRSNRHRRSCPAEWVAPIYPDRCRCPIETAILGVRGRWAPALPALLIGVKLARADTVFLAAQRTRRRYSESPHRLLRVRAGGGECHLPALGLLTVNPNLVSSNTVTFYT